MADPVVFYTHPLSRGRIVRWMLEEIGEPYQTELLEYGTTMKAPAYLAINSMGKVPAIRHRGTVVTEVGAICAYLADAFADAQLAPPTNDPARGAYYRWLFFAAGPLDAAMTNKALNFEPPDERRGMVGYGSLADVITTLDAAVADRTYLVGDGFTAADLLVSSYLFWGMEFGTIEKRETFDRYCQRHMQRPAAVKTKAIDDALLPPDGAPG